MAETAAMAIGIAGAASVLQSLLQCYKDFLVARDFGRDYETRVVKLDLLQLSVKNWGLAIGLIDDSEAAQNQFHISQSTEENIQAVKRSITHLKRLFEDANKALDRYMEESSTTAESYQSQEANQLALEEDKRWKAMSRKIHRMVHREHDQQHPGSIKRGQWALLDKERIDKLIDDISTVVDRLRSDFPPVDKAQLQKLYQKELVNIGLTDEELVMLKNVAKSTDTLLKEVADRVVTERGAGHSFKNFDTTNGSAVILGDFFADAQQRSPRASLYTDIKTAVGSFTMAGNIYGGKNPFEMYIQKMEPAKAAGAG